MKCQLQLARVFLFRAVTYLVSTGTVTFQVTNNSTSRHKRYKRAQRIGWLLHLPAWLDFIAMWEGSSRVRFLHKYVRSALPFLIVHYKHQILFFRLSGHQSPDIACPQ